MDVQKIYFTLAADAESATYGATAKLLDDYFVPKANVPFERHLFRQILQESEETVDQFEEILGEDEVPIEEDVVVVVEGRKKQTLWLTEITMKNLPDRFSIVQIVPSLHLLWSS